MGWQETSYDLLHLDPHALLRDYVTAIAKLGKPLPSSMRPIIIFEI